MTVGRQYAKLFILPNDGHLTFMGHPHPVWYFCHCVAHIGHVRYLVHPRLTLD